MLDPTRSLTHSLDYDNEHNIFGAVITRTTRNLFYILFICKNGIHGRFHWIEQSKAEQKIKSEKEIEVRIKKNQQQHE